MDRQKVKKIRDLVEAELKAFLELRKNLGLGVGVSFGNGRYDDTQVTFSVTFAETAADGTLQTPQATAYLKFQKTYGFVPLNSAVQFAGKTWKVVGFVPGRSKYPILAQRQPDGKRFKLPLAAAQRQTAKK